MKIVSIQKVIKVGSSLAVTIPAKDAKFYGIQAGREVEVAITLPEVPAQQANSALDAEYQAFKAQYGDTLKNLANR